MKTRQIILLPAMLLCCALARAQAAPTLAREFTQGYNIHGGTLDVRLHFANPDGQPMNALYVVEELPAGWTFSHVVSDSSGAVPGDRLDGAAGLSKFECIWLETPTNNAFTLVYRVNVPAGNAGVKTFSGEMDWAYFHDNPQTVATGGGASVVPENQVLTPVITPASGARFEDTLTVTITCATTNAVIRHTLDGSEPTAASAPYTSPFTIARACTVKARAFLAGKADSEVASATYYQSIESGGAPMVGVRMDRVLATLGAPPLGGVFSLVKVSRASLPSGLKIALVKDAYGNHSAVLSGAPTAVNKAPLTVVYEVRVKVGKDTATLTTIEINFDAVEPFPKFANAAYNGWVRIPGGPDNGLGVLTMTLSTKGAISGKIVLNGTSRTFKAAAFNSRAGSLLSATVDIKSGTKFWDILDLDVDAATGLVAASLRGVPDAEACIFRNPWNDAGMAAFFADAFNGYYTAQIPSDGFGYPAETAPRGAGFLTLTLSTKGAARWSGKLADGRSFSGSGALLRDAVADAFYLPVTAAYNANKAGFAALVEIRRGPAKATNTLVSHDGFWRNADFKSVYTDYLELDLRNPPLLGAGFNNSVRVAGGFYNKNENIAAHYLGQTLALGNDPFDRELAHTFTAAGNVRTTQYAPAASQGPAEPLTLAGNTATAGLVLTLKNDLKKIDGFYNYDTALNPLGLTFKFTRATGLFSGRFNIYYDYYARENATTLTHAQKAVSYSGLLTPWRDAADAALPEGAGYYLLNLGEKCWYIDAKGAIKSYPFSKWSYGFWIFSAQ